MSANSLTIAAARDSLRKGEISAVDLTMSCLTAIDAGNVNQRIDVFQLVNRCHDCGFDLFRITDVTSQAGHSHPRLIHFLHGCIDGFLTAAADHNLRSATRKSLCNRAPNAATAAGDQNMLSRD